MDLGILRTITPRVKWNNEARDFTPWLASNIEELNKALGLELEVENTEVAVGPYSANFLAQLHWKRWRSLTLSLPYATQLPTLKCTTKSIVSMQ